MSDDWGQLLLDAGVTPAELRQLGNDLLFYLTMVEEYGGKMKADLPILNTPEKRAAFREVAARIAIEETP